MPPATAGQEVNVCHQREAFTDMPRTAREDVFFGLVRRPGRRVEQSIHDAILCEPLPCQRGVCSRGGEANRRPLGEVTQQEDAPDKRLLSGVVREEQLPCSLAEAERSFWVREVPARTGRLSARGPAEQSNRSVHSSARKSRPCSSTRGALLAGNGLRWSMPRVSPSHARGEPRVSSNSSGTGASPSHRQACDRSRSCCVGADCAASAHAAERSGRRAPRSESGLGKGADRKLELPSSCC